MEALVTLAALVGRVMLVPLEKEDWMEEMAHKVSVLVSAFK